MLTTFTLSINVSYYFSGRPKTKSLVLPKIDNGRNHNLGKRRTQSQTVQPYLPGDPLTLELQHGQHKQSVQLPTESLDKSKKYYVTFTINQSPKSGGEGGGAGAGTPAAGAAVETTLNLTNGGAKAKETK